VASYLCVFVLTVAWDKVSRIRYAGLPPDAKSKDLRMAAIVQVSPPGIMDEKYGRRYDQERLRRSASFYASR